MPNFLMTPSSSRKMSRRRSQLMTLTPETDCARSLSGEHTTTCSTPGWFLKRDAPVARASSASNCTIGQTTIPSAETALSARGNWPKRSVSTPSLVLYPGKSSLRKDSMTWSKAHAMCVIPGVETSERETPQEAKRSADLTSVRGLLRRSAEVAAKELVGSVDQMDLHSFTFKRILALRVMPPNVLGMTSKPALRTFRPRIPQTAGLAVSMRLLGTP